MPYSDYASKLIQPPSCSDRPSEFPRRASPHQRFDTHMKISVLILLLLTMNAYAGVYKWTDAQGRVHYSDTPPPRQETQRVRTDRTNAAEAAAARRSLADKLSESDLRRKKAQEDEDKRKSEAEKQRAMAERCVKAREQLTLLQQTARISRVDSQGQRYIMGDAERAAAIQEAQKRADEYCQ